MTSHEGALSDIRVLDLGTITAGAGTSVTFADFGADVIKVESAGRFDSFRSWSQIQSAQNGPDFSPPFHTVNRGKRGISIDLKHPRGREVLLQLVAESDIVVENFRRGVLEKLGIGYDVLSEVNPRIVLLSLTSQGSTGPESQFISYGSTLDALGGLMSVTGYDASTPTWSSNNVNFPDQLVTFYAPLAGLAAIRYRDATGRGCWVDFSQRESVTSVLGEYVVARSGGAELPMPTGNRTGGSAPHDVYPTADDDRWMAISIADDSEWSNLVVAVDSIELVAPRFASAVGRVIHADDIDAVLVPWASSFGLDELDAILTQNRVPHAIVRNASEVLRDPQLEALGFFLNLDLPIGAVRQRGFAARLSVTPGAVRRPAPALGAETREILHDVLGLSDADIDELEGDGAIAPTAGYQSHRSELVTS